MEPLQSDYHFQKESQCGIPARTFLKTVGRRKAGPSASTYDVDRPKKGNRFGFVRLIAMALPELLLNGRTAYNSLRKNPAIMATERGWLGVAVCCR
jgi:hypothetical protein